MPAMPACAGQPLGDALEWPGRGQKGWSPEGQAGPPGLDAPRLAQRQLLLHVYAAAVRMGQLLHGAVE
jgi:hypothetical protein